LVFIRSHYVGFPKHVASQVAMRHTVLLNEAWACIRRGCVIVKHNAAAVVNLASLPTVKSVTVLTYFDEYDAVERSLPVHQYINFIKTFNLDGTEIPTCAVDPSFTKFNYHGLLGRPTAQKERSPREGEGVRQKNADNGRRVSSTLTFAVAM